MTYRDFANNIADMKNRGDGLMSVQQYFSIGYTLAVKAPCNFLIFGLGEESSHWKNLNSGGRTVFLEDDVEWIEKFNNRGLEIYDVKYNTFAGDHEKIGFDESLLKMELPDNISSIDWDMILVDAPLGHGPPGRSYKGPGRMQSIYTAYTLLKPGGICVVDDMKRLIEQKYSLHFFGEENLINIIEEKVAIFKKKVENKSLGNLIENKTVALVGPAQYMEKSNLGEEIDGHDIVIRINRGIESIDKFSKDIGKRTDIYYSCLIERAQQTGNLNVKSLKEKHGIKWIVAPPESDMQGLSSSTTLHSLVNKEKIAKISNEIPVRIIDHVFHTELARLINCKPNTGFLAIYDILRMNPKNLSLYGFSFYLDGFISGQKSGVEKEKNCSEQEFADMAYNSKRHVQKNMWHYAKRTLQQNPRVKLDSTLEKILNMKRLDRDLFNKTVK